MNARFDAWKPFARALPFGYAIVLPLLPLLIELADVLPRGVAVAGRTFAGWLAVIVALILVAGVVASAAAWGVAAMIRMPVAAALLALAVTESIAAAAGVSPSSGAFEIASQIGCGLAAIVFWLTMRDDGARRGFLACFFASGIAACAFAIALTLSRHPPAAFA